MKTSNRLHSYEDVKYIAFIWRHQIYCNHMETSSILHSYEDVKYIAFIWRRQTYCTHMEASNSILHSYGDVKYIAFIWRRQIYCNHMETSNILHSYGDVKYIAFIWRRQIYCIHMETSSERQLWSLSGFSSSLTSREGYFFQSPVDMITILMLKCNNIIKTKQWITFFLLKLTKLWTLVKILWQISKSYTYVKGQH